MEPRKILLVDDEIDFVSTLAERLRLRDMIVTTASDGEEALRAVEEAPPDVVLLDVMMPGLGGFEVLKRIKHDHPEIVVILLTGHGSTNDGIEGMRSGAADYLMKPIKLEELTRKIDEAFEAPPGS